MDTPTTIITLAGTRWTGRVISRRTHADTIHGDLEFTTVRTDDGLDVFGLEVKR